MELKGSLLIKASVEVGKVMQPGLSALHSALQPDPAPRRLLFSLRFPADLKPGVVAGTDIQRGGNLFQVQRNQKAPG